MKGKPKVLVVDDDERSRRLLSAMLSPLGYEVTEAWDGEEAVQKVGEAVPDLVLLDIMMPKMDGYTACRQIREFSQVPVIMVTARGNEGEKIQGLDAGADDYVTKPFSVHELAARVRAVLRRVSAWEEVPEPEFSSADLVIDFARHMVTLKGKELDLTATEYRLLSYLARNAGRLLTPDQILEKVWGEEYVGEHHLLQVNVARLRQKLRDDARDPQYIVTKTGIGYSMKKPT